MTPDQIDTTLQTIAKGFRTWPRAPLLHWPDEAGLAYEDVFFPSEDGVPLEAWFVPCAGSDRIVVANHPRWFNRAGLPSHLHPWKQFGDATGNDFEVNFVPDYRILHDAGYNVLAYDLRNFGHSGAANGGRRPLRASAAWSRRSRCRAGSRWNARWSGWTYPLFSWAT